MLRLLGGIYVAVVAIIVGFWLVLVVSARADASLNPNTWGYIFYGFIFLIAPLLVPVLVAGVGLLLGYRWARVIAVIASIMFLLVFPIGTPLGAFGLWVLWKERGKASAPVDVAKALAPFSEHLSPGEAKARAVADPKGGVRMILGIAAVGLGFVVVIGAGFRISGDPAPPEIALVFWPAVIALAAVIVCWILTLRRSPGANPFRHLAFHNEQSAYRAERAAWLAGLRADPRTAPYAAAVERGEPWTDDRIAYDLDPDARETCACLAGIEGDMRAAGLRVRHQRDRRVEADCRIDQERLASAYALPEGVGYQELSIPDRSLHDPPVAMIACPQHDSAIQVVWEGQARPETPVFP